MDADNALSRPVVMVPASSGNTYTLVKGTILGEVTASKKYNAYVDANSDGTNVARGILQYSITVDDAGNITMSVDRSFTETTTPMWFQGIFLSTDLTGLDANGLADLQGWVVNGTITTGMIKF
jgi:hypothetical protein